MQILCQSIAINFLSQNNGEKELEVATRMKLTSLLF